MRRSSCGVRPTGARMPCATSASTAAPRCRWAGSPTTASCVRITAWRYDADRRVRAHSAVGARHDSRQGENRRLYRCQERYGLIWVALAEAEPAYAVPEVPELGASRGRS